MMAATTLGRPAPKPHESPGSVPVPGLSLSGLPALRGLQGLVDGSARVHREGCRAHLALVLEVQEQAVRAGAGCRSREGDLGAGVRPAVSGLAVGVDVQCLHTPTW